MLWHFTSLANTQINKGVSYIIYAIRLSLGSLLFSGQNHQWDPIYLQISLTLAGQVALLALSIFDLKFKYVFEIWISYLHFIHITHVISLYPHKCWWMGLSATRKI